MTDSLEESRSSLDNIDSALVYLLAERFRITQKVGIYKRDNGLPPVDSSRESLQFEKITELAKKSGLSPEFAEKFLRTIIDEVVAEHIRIRKAKDQ